MDATKRSDIVERKNDSFLDLYERLKVLNSPLKNEREFEPHHRSSSTKPMTDICYINNNKKEESVRDIINKDKERGTGEKSTRGRRNRGSSIGLSGGILYFFYSNYYVIRYYHKFN